MYQNLDANICLTMCYNIFFCIIMELETVTAPELKAYFSLLVRVPLTEKEVCLSLAEVNCNTLDESLEKMYKCLFL